MNPGILAWVVSFAGSRGESLGLRTEAPGGAGVEGLPKVLLKLAGRMVSIMALRG